MTPIPQTAQERAETHQSIADIATLKVQMAHVTQALADVKIVNTLQSEKLDAVLLRLAEAKGGWRTMLWFGGAAATFGGGVMALVGWAMDHLPRPH